ncbi:uncharacterized protein EI90DRAFT_3072829 [Cantharellus anzutake]|uniref:uncharacterized protein n=1 Tax=Cantharellus anzutake TaxID=1750568 RepID=UPI001904D3E3|nr:uncharacterized protein EI90DRAFT_3072829 [Cantharellus anzutake]KAF8325428.1 hypothetical protein EI90DRAFT_3072829 [Cantharellus anzutake]
MNPLHAAFASDSQKAFQQLLDRTSVSSPKIVGAGTAVGSAPGSWTLGSVLSAPPVDVNAKEHLGKTVLHRACSSLEPSSISYVRMLLSHNAVNVNIQDTENGWTALHRSLYVGNIAAAILLLQHSEIDTSIKDYDGYTAFELYNSTVGNTCPVSGKAPSELFTWGSNRNASLGLGDSNDRSYPELVSIPNQCGNEVPKLAGSARFYPVPLIGLDMSKFHTVVVRKQERANILLCGFGGGGRLGPRITSAQHSFGSLLNISNVVSVACGPDHTLALTKQGDVLSWGLNRFSQLGYVVEIATPSRRRYLDEQWQIIPRRIVGALKGKAVRGVAACRMASVAWTREIVYTWGTNGGQLGYGGQVQVSPRAVSSLGDPVISVTITDVAMACLTENHDVICYSNHTHFRVGFPVNTLPPDLVSTYRPPHSVGRPAIKKIASHDHTFAALSDRGDVYTFTIASTNQAIVDGQNHMLAGKEKCLAMKPQKVWAMCRQMSAATDVSLGPDGALILCTVSGHVYVRTRSSKPPERHTASILGTTDVQANKLFRFQRVLFLQRIVRVYTNSIGSFAALRQEVKLGPIALSGTRLKDDMNGIRPFAFSSHSTHHAPGAAEISTVVENITDADLDDEDGDTTDSLPVEQSVKALSQLAGAIGASRCADHNVTLSSPNGADTIVHCDVDIPVHGVILASRCPAFRDVLQGHFLEDMANRICINADASARRLNFVGVHTLTVLILLHYLYTDELPKFWNPLVVKATTSLLTALHIDPWTIKSQLQTISRLLDLAPLMKSLQGTFPKSTLASDMAYLFAEAQNMLSLPPDIVSSHLPTHDVVIELADRRVACHSVILRARSPVFAAFFDDDDWTRERWKDGIIELNFKHKEWKVMSLVFRFMYEDVETSLFDTIDFADTLDTFLDFVLSVMESADELFLDRLVLICSSVILRHVSISNVTSLLMEAHHFRVQQLIRELETFIAVNAECMLECRLLDGLPSEVVASLAATVRQQQAKEFPVSRSNQKVQAAMERNADWLHELDVPQPIMRSWKAILAMRPFVRKSPTNVTTGGRARRPSPSAVLPTYSVSEITRESLFVMDEELTPQVMEPKGEEVAIVPPFEEPSSKGVWRSKNAPVPKMDLRAIMAEAEKEQAAPGRTTKGKTRSIGFEPSPPQPFISPTSPPRDMKKPWGSSTDRRTKTGMVETPSDFPLLSSAISSPAPAAPQTGAPPRQVGFDVIPASRPSPPSPSGSKLGPIITPTRLPPGMKRDAPGKRRVPNYDAWSAPPPEPPFPPPEALTDVSLVNIQEQQTIQRAYEQRPKLSFLDIQREEEELQTEVNFLKWWTAEEERIRLEADRSSGLACSPKSKGKRSGGRKSKARKADKYEQSSSPSSAKTPFQVILCEQ